MESKRGTKYKGFGRELTAAEWARVAGLPRNSVCRYLASGWTIEEIFSYRRIKYDPQANVNTGMKRIGHKMADTIDLVMELLRNSGYKPDEKAVRISVLPNNAHHITYRGKYIGWYDYKDDVLHLKDGNTLKIKNPIVEKPMLAKNMFGEWCLHKETKHAIIDIMFQSRAE